MPRPFVISADESHWVGSHGLGSGAKPASMCAHTYTLGEYGFAPKRLQMEMVEKVNCVFSDN